MMATHKHLQPRRIARRLWRDAHRILPRRIHVYGVGLGRTGTTSLAWMFRPHFRSGHEADADHFARISAKQIRGLLDSSAVRSELRDRSRRLALEVDVGGFWPPFAHELADLYPQARFILTIRDCFSWLESWLGHLLGNPLLTPGSPWREWLDASIPHPYQYSSQDGFLEELELPPVGAALDLWARMNGQVVRGIPAERLLVVRTEELDQSLERIAAFCAVRPSALRAMRANVAHKQRRILDTVPADCLFDAASRSCAPLMERFWGPRWHDLAPRTER